MSDRLRLALWSGLIIAFAALGYAARFSGGESNARDAVYSYATFVGGTLQYAIWLGLVLAIAAGKWELFALRRPESWASALALAAGALVLVYVVSAIVAQLPIRNPGDEQGLTPTGWEPQHAGAFAANVVLFAVIAPIVEELTFRGLGQSLLARTVGRWASVVVVGVAFGAAHGLLEALTILVPFGIALAYVRDRTDSVYPCIVAHAAFNAVALVAAVTV